MEDYQRLQQEAQARHCDVLAAQQALADAREALETAKELSGLVQARLEQKRRALLRIGVLPVPERKTGGTQE